MEKKIKNSEQQKQRLIQGIASEIDLMKTNLIRRIEEMPDGSLSEFVTSKKAANILDISLPTLNKYVRQGLISRYRLGNRVYYHRDELFTALSSQFNNIKNEGKV